MFKLSHLIAALIATVAIASPPKLAPSDCQVPLRASVLQPQPPPPPLPCCTILLSFNDASCTVPEAAVYELSGNYCYYLPYSGADLVFQPCSQSGFRPFASAPIPSPHSLSHRASHLTNSLPPTAMIFTDANCSTGGVVLPPDTCTNVESYLSIYVTCP
jgi:hypothetical protein